MPDSPRSEPESTFVCDCDDFVRSACIEEPFFGRYLGKQYCVLHFPANQKTEAFKIAFQKKIANKDFNFSGVWFPEALILTREVFDGDVDFSRSTFSSSLNLRRVIFSGNVDFAFATFEGLAEFAFVTFGGTARFTRGQFNNKARFPNVTFNESVNFVHTKFGVVDFRRSTFKEEADFRWVGLTLGDFSGATFKDYLRFSGSRVGPIMRDLQYLNLQFCRFEQPRRISFHRLILRPHWFANVNAHEFEFTEVKWDLRKVRRTLVNSSGEQLILTAGSVVRACRNLADNAEDNHRYSEASKFRFMAMDSQRRETWHGLSFWNLSWWYWLGSGYGERVSQAFLMLIGLFLLFAMFYTQVGFVRWEPRITSAAETLGGTRDEVGASLPFKRALTYSLGVMTLQKPEPRPATTAAQTVVLLETVLGPVQAALLALAIRRKFMR